MRVTIAVLPVSLSLVHVPRSRLPQLFHSVIKQILQHDPVFLSVTSNEIELSIFAESCALQEFALIARRDRLKLLRHSRSGSACSRQSPCRDFEPIEVSCEKWRVLQIDSHSDQLDTSGARVNELSAPLAAAGISILYQSSYMSDFIFLKESCLQKALDLFSNAGFDLYPTNTNFSASGQVMSQALSDVDLRLDVGSIHSGAILTRTQSKSEHTDALGITFTPEENNHEEVVSGSGGSGRSSPHSSSHSPISSEVVVLSPDLACVGLSDEFGVDHWGLKIVKLVAFPDLISPIKAKSPATTTQSPVEIPILSDVSLSYNVMSPDLSLSSSTSEEEDDGYFSHSPQNGSPKYSLPRMAYRSQADLTKTPLNTPSKHRKPTQTPLDPVHMPGANNLTNGSHVPFFSFTRTAEGSSLTTDVHLLATLFPPHERHMVICGAELAVADDANEEESSDAYGSTLKCLQVDLRQFGLDKHGLVNRFSGVLASNGINHMYSSTFKTANLLVEKRHANRAQHLLSTF